MAEEQVTQADVDELVELMREAASAYIGGEIRRYFALMQHADDFTLMDPFGGETTRESGASDERIAALEAMFRGGECELDVVQAYASGNVAVSSSWSDSTATWADTRPRTGRCARRWCSGARTTS